MKVGDKVRYADGYLKARKQEWDGTTGTVIDIVPLCSTNVVTVAWKGNSVSTLFARNLQVVD